MGVWADLPAEIAILVLHTLEPTADEKAAAEKLDASAKFRVNQDVLNCTYVSRQFRTIAESLLYRDIFYPECEGTTEERHFVYRFYQLTRAIIMRPALGKYVHEITLPSMRDGVIYGYRDLDSMVSRCNNDYDDRNKISGSISDLGGKASQDLEHILKALPTHGLRTGLAIRGGPYGVLLTLLHFLPKLRILDIVIGHSLGYFSLSCFGVFVGGIPAGLRSISGLLIYHEDFESTRTFLSEEVLLFMALPSLKSFAFDAFVADHRDNVSHTLELGVDFNTAAFSISNKQRSDNRLPRFMKTSDGYALPARLSSITTLQISSSAVSSELVNRILAIPSQIEKFENTSLDKPHSRHSFRPAQFLPGLLSHAPSLRELVLDTDFLDPSGRDEPFIGSLCGLVALETLRISPRVLIPPAAENSDERTPATYNPMDKLLPPNLATLELFLKIGKLPDLLKRTGIPNSIRFTRRCTPSLVNFSLNGSPNYNYSSNKRVIGLAKQMPALQLPMKGSIFVSSLAPILL